MSYVAALAAGGELPCVPAMLAERGYETISLHGYTQRVFQRDLWYPKLGFHTVLFAEQLARPGVDERCGGVHRGLCDDQLAELVGQTLRAHPERLKFVSFLTLNTHIPYEMPPGRVWAYACRTPHAPVEDPAVCDLMNLWRLVFQRLAAELGRSDMPPTEVLIVGDHPPPLFRAASRGLFQPQRVPWLLAEPVITR
jgi:phosphoglycerol transferase MdoB-like AlkP superfamily enzyme